MGAEPRETKKKLLGDREVSLLRCLCQRVARDQRESGEQKKRPLEWGLRQKGNMGGRGDPPDPMSQECLRPLTFMWGGLLREGGGETKKQELCGQVLLTTELIKEAEVWAC